MVSQKPRIEMRSCLRNSGEELGLTDGSMERA